MRDGRLIILFITHGCTLGGANRSMLQLIRELRVNHGVEPYVLAKDEGAAVQALPEECLRQEIPFVRFRFYHFKQANRGVGIRLRYLLNLVLYPLILFRIRHIPFDCVYSNSSILSLGAFVSRMTHKPHITHLREFGEQDFDMKPLGGKWHERRVYAGSDRFIAISKAVGEAYGKVIDSHRISVVYNGIPPCDASLNALHGHVTVQLVMVGVVQPAKNQLEALQAVKELLRRGVTAVHLNFIGACDLDYKARLDDYVRVNGLESYVTFYGERGDVPQLLSQMDVGLMLSRAEGFGRVTVEFMMQQLAVVAADAGANAEIVESDRVGLLYTLGDIGQLADHLQRLVENPPLVQSMGREARRHALACFSSQRNSEAVYKIVQDVVGNRTGVSVKEAER